MTKGKRSYPNRGFKILESDAPLLERLSEGQRDILTTTDKTADLMTRMQCAEGTLKSRRNRARAALIKLREKAIAA